MLGRISKGVTREVKEKAFMKQIIEYAVTVWDPYVEEEVWELEKVPRAARWVKGSTVESGRWRRQGQNDEEGNYRPSVMMKEMGWSSLKDRRKVKRLVRMYRVVKEEGGRGGLHRKLSKGVFRGRGNNSEKLQRVWRRTERGRQSILVRTVREWNVLREVLVSVRGVGKFRGEWKRSWLREGEVRELATRRLEAWDFDMWGRASFFWGFGMQSQAPGQWGFGMWSQAHICWTVENSECRVWHQISEASAYGIGQQGRHATWGRGMNLDRLVNWCLPKILTLDHEPSEVVCPGVSAGRGKHVPFAGQTSTISACAGKMLPESAGSYVFSAKDAE
ncbi:hypothetical protein PR048_029449 [Dryococelus australis]|uniref:Uncharacterized protein n=1 Tax=Dryococelus australis TaxID=614101 RepID=A0ABQ9GDD8_9NEOP|nr:hypothetical protein PR048_029449 [Dryococelus australis]